MQNQLASIKEAKQPRTDQSKERVIQKEPKNFAPTYDSGDEERPNDAKPTKNKVASQSIQKKNDDLIGLADQIMAQVSDMLEQNEMEEKSLRDKIQLYFSMRQQGSEFDDAEDAMFDEDSSLNNGSEHHKGKRNPPGVRVRPGKITAAKLKTAKGLA